MIPQMVANAGITAVTDILTETVENWERMMTVNATSTFLCYKYSALQMVKQGCGGRIIGASSMVGKQASAGSLSYSASKFAVRGLTQAAALQLGRNGITVNSYAPGAIETPMCLIESSAVGYIGQPENIASAVSYLASKEAHFITGKFLIQQVPNAN
ncbi:NAD(P)-binding protein [Rhizopogon vinicolor AM-OR11-026]|uniref:NAD(P)-binding protein n=1 Tax=Rhizopogon vinicolor AM-OR11-026 TaxID=1314800 RepID=A0A1B7MVA8_9AGAM|nr:NAD(P)-binding protein [Rhizopogon vinicolor AM-OR11-026]